MAGVRTSDWRLVKRQCKAACSSTAPLHSTAQLASPPQEANPGYHYFLVLPEPLPDVGVVLQSAMGAVFFEAMLPQAEAGELSPAHAPACRTLPPAVATRHGAFFLKQRAAPHCTTISLSHARPAPLTGGHTGAAWAPLLPDPLTPPHPSPQPVSNGYQNYQRCLPCPALQASRVPSA